MQSLKTTSLLSLCVFLFAIPCFGMTKDFIDTQLVYKAYLQDEVFYDTQNRIFFYNENTLLVESFELIDTTFTNYVDNASHLSLIDKTTGLHCQKDFFSMIATLKQSNISSLFKEKIIALFINCDQFNSLLFTSQQQKLRKKLIYTFKHLMYKIYAETTDDAEKNKHYNTFLSIVENTVTNLYMQKAKIHKKIVLWCGLTTIFGNASLTLLKETIPQIEEPAYMFMWGSFNATGYTMLFYWNFYSKYRQYVSNIRAQLSLEL